MCFLSIFSKNMNILKMSSLSGKTLPFAIKVWREIQNVLLLVQVMHTGGLGFSVKDGFSRILFLK